jgi:peptidyl-prolyl cis-trans isomerase C
MRLSSLLSTAALAALLASTPFVTTPAFAAETKGAEAEDYIILRVNGEAVSRSRVLSIWNSLFPEGKSPDFDSFDDKVRMNVLRGIVSEQLVYGAAKKSGIENSPEVTEKLAKLKEKLVMQAYLERKAAAKVTAEDVRKAYDEQVAAIKGKEEIKARHILVDSKEKAEEIVEKLEDDEKFEDLAKKESLDKGSGARGGDLGWFPEGRMVQEFSKAAFALDKGEISKPVKTNFGWHVIQVEDRRTIKAPPFDEVKEALQKDLKAKALNDHVNELLQGAKVQYFAPDGTEKPFSKDLPDGPAKGE